MEETLQDRLAKANTKNEEDTLIIDFPSFLVDTRMYMRTLFFEHNDVTCFVIVNIYQDKTSALEAFDILTSGLKPIDN